MSLIIRFTSLGDKKWDMVLDCTGEAEQMARLIVPGGKVISVAHFPTPASLDRYALPLDPPAPPVPEQKGSIPVWVLRSALWLKSRGARNAAEANGGTYEYLMLKGNYGDLEKVERLVSEGKVKLLVDQVFKGIDSFKEAFARIETGRAVGKVIIEL